MKNYPSLQTISRLLIREKRSRAVFSALPVAAGLLSLHLVILAVLGFLSVKYPLSRHILLQIMFSYSLYLLVPLHFVWIWTHRKNSVKAVAGDLDKLNPQAYDAFQTSLSLRNHPEKTLYLLDEFYRGILASLRFPRRTLFPLGIKLAWLVSICLWIILGVISPDYRSYLARTFVPMEQLKEIPILKIHLTADKRIAGRGDTITFKGLLQNYVPGQNLYAHIKDAGGENRFPLKGIKDTAVFTVGPVSEDFEVYFSGINGSSNAVSLKVLEPPYVSSIQAVVTPPGYTKSAEDTLPPGTTNFSVLPGSEVQWELTASRPLKELVWESKWRQGKNQSAETARREVLGKGSRFSITKSLYLFSSSLGGKKDSSRHGMLPYTYNIYLTDEYGIKSKFPVRSIIEVNRDRAPTVNILLPEQNAAIDRNEKMEVALLVKDDFGIRSLRLGYRITSDGFLKDSSVITVSGWLKNKKGNFVTRIWDIGFMDMRPDNVLDFYFLACDNDMVGGSKCSRSESRIMRFPSIQEIIAETRKKEAKARSFLKSAYERQQKVSDKLKRVSRKEPKDGLRLSSFELRKILISEPGQIHQRGHEILEQINRRPEGSPDRSRSADLDDRKDKVRGALRKSRQSVPTPDVLLSPPEKQLEALEKLHHNQQELYNQCTGLSNDLEKSGTEYAREKKQLQRMNEDLAKNLENQEDLKEYLNSKIQEAKREEILKDQLLKEQSEVLEDMEQGVRELEKFMKKSMDTELFSPEIVEKMERIQELLQETMPDSLMEMMKKKAEGEAVDARSVKESLQQLLENREAFEQNINRALAMLEKLRNEMKLEEWRRQLAENMRRQEFLREDVENTGGRTSDSAALELGRRQEFIKQSTEKILEDIRKTSQQTNGWQQLYPALKKQRLPEEMEKARQSLSHPGASSPGQASGHCKAAVKKFKSAMQILSEFSSKMNGNSISINIAEIELLLEESLQLSRLQEIVREGESRRLREGWHSSPSAIYANCAQAAKWMNQEIKRMSAQNPFISSYLLTQSRLLASSLNQASLAYNPASSSKALTHNQNVARELLKLLKIARSLPSGSGQGQSGESSSGNDPQNKGSGSMENLSSQLKGMSGKQLAINTATSKLLKAMLQGRKGGRDRGKKPGGISAQEMANRQGNLGEDLEHMAESAGEEGRATEKLRRLAEEARSLEKELRTGRISARTEKNQEQFKSRLLEASKALKERGYGSRREGEHSKTSFGQTSGLENLKKSDWILLIEKEKKRALNMDLGESQRKVLNEYYEGLLTR
ncbi:hypothetical protein ACFL5V_03660 [Fibrobacterota bacterium]